MGPANCVTLTRYFFSAAERPDDVLSKQLDQAADVVDGIITRPLLPFQNEALICLVSDLVAGVAASPSGSFTSSLLVKAINRGMLQIAAAEFYQFCFRGGELSRRAWEKRRVEQTLFSRGELLFP